MSRVIFFCLVFIGACGVQAFNATPTFGKFKNVVSTIKACSQGDERSSIEEMVSSSGSISRASVLRVIGAALTGPLTLGAFAGPSVATRSIEQLAGLVRDARRQLDPVDELITQEKWDGIRNIIKTSPLADLKNVISELARQMDEDESAILMGMRQDVLDHVQYLDSFSYNNVFVGEDRQILGTKKDFDTPRMELRQCREAIDVIVEMLPALPP